MTEPAKAPLWHLLVISANAWLTCYIRKAVPAAHHIGQAGSPDRDPPRELQVPGGTFHSLTPRQITSLLTPEGFYLFGEHATVTLNWTKGEPTFDWRTFLSRSSGSS